MWWLIILMTVAGIITVAFSYLVHTIMRMAREDVIEYIDDPFDDE